MKGIAAWVRAHKSLAVTVVLAVLAGVPLTLAVLHQGFPVTDPDLHARNVWVTNGEKLLAGRLNRQIEELDAAVATASSDADVFQDGDDVFLYDPGAGSIERIDRAYTTLVQRIDVPPSSQVAFGGGVLAVLSPKGELWRVPAGGELAFDWRGTDPIAKLAGEARVAVSTHGTVFGTSSKKRTVLALAKDELEPASTKVAAFGAHQLAAVGEEPVVLDTADSRLITRERAIDLPTPGVRLQQSGPAADDAVVATGEGLLEVPLAGGTVEQVAAEADPVDGDPERIAAPARVGACVHAAWVDSARYLKVCDGESTAIDIPDVSSGARLEFRVNRDVIALNDLRTGDSWLADDELTVVDNWSDVTPPKDGETDEEGDEEVSQQTFEDALAQRTEQNRPPVANDDEYGVRPGRATILDVLSNDSDVDGDVLVIAKTSEISEQAGRLESIDGGRALQFTPAAGLTGTVSFRYGIDDGRDGVAEASVNVSVSPETVNEPPTLLRKTALSVEQGQKTTYNVLADWRDPDGDDLYLVNASPKSGDAVRTSPDGYLTFEHKSSELGRKEVQYTVSDGATTATGTLVVEVKPAGAMEPIGTPDYQQAFVGQTVQLTPLANDVSPSGAPIKLLGVVEADDQPDWFGLTPNLERGVISFSATEPGDAQFMYELGAGEATSRGLIRVHVTEPPASLADAPPIAVRDTAYLRAGEPATIPVLANDVSQSGSVLAVQTVDDAAVQGQVTVEMVSNAAIRVSSSEALDKQVQFAYTISDGSQTSTSTVTVVPVPPLVKHQPPVAIDDRATVRAGDIVTVPVLANDFHPDGATMHVADELDVRELQGAGLAFVSRDHVRYQAPDEPGTYRLVYTLTDDFGQVARAQVVFDVTKKGGGTNRSPLPEPLTARVFEGSVVRIDVPLDGLDPDGDSVVLTGLENPPALGRVVGRTSRSISYEAFPGSTGTDTFSYTLSDAFGATAVGTIRVGVIPRPPIMLPPKAVDDAIEMRPGRTGSAEVLLNDTDPSGYALQVSGIPEVSEGLTAEIDDQRRIVVTAPKEEGGYTIRYEISNGHGGVDSAFLQIAVKKDAKILPPTAEDQVVEPEEVADGQAVNVDPLHDATNPGGLVDDLVVTVEGPNADAAKVRSDGSIDVTPGAERFAVAYRVTNEVDDLSAMAFVIVPPVPGQEVPLEDRPKSVGGPTPTPTPGASEKPEPTKQKTKEELEKEERDKYPAPHLKQLDPIVVPMNGSIEWSVDDLVEVPSGQPALILSATAQKARSDAFVDGTHLQFQPEKDYRGPASITFEVTDGKDADDPIGRKALLTLPITVGDANYNDTPPTFTPRQETIEAGEAPIEIDLRQSTGQPNPDNIDKIGYGNLKSTNAKINGEIVDGHTLRVSAPLGVQKGEQSTFSFDLTFNEFTVKGSVDIKVVSSTRASASANDDAVDMLRSESKTVDVLANDFNPFAQDGKPLRIVAAEINQADVGSNASVTFTATDVTVRTGAAFTGTLSVVYTVEDATEDPDRRVRGNLIVTVRDKPDTPGAPSATAAGSQTANVRWQAPADNNSPILDYTLIWTGGGQRTFPASAAGVTQTITGLTNGTAHTFQVLARNAIGMSSYSAPSPAVTPYGTPGTPSVNASVSGYAPGTINASWSTPTTGGGSLKYTACLNNGSCKEVTGTSTSWGGAGAGTYRVTVKATNSGGLTGGTGTSNAVSVENPPPPPKVVSLSRSAAESCSNGNWGCTWYVISVSGFPANTTQTVQTFCGSDSVFRTTSMWVGGDGRGTFDGSKTKTGGKCANWGYVIVGGVRSNNW
ncbi:Ig-like domain-containing protein [Agromyces endophyticus]|uniref:Ig-like domain-containing protein n=1 Tax=Agromyces sp. H17E-10 TaxID=2932244 RepID=UPI001FD5452A|nr:Ig-like domain-containing protein [Agromyces sp. H17E-10]UOQ88819.1 Ig-like domain-containing protein [Agromyces sp. H17E-10]